MPDIPQRAGRDRGRGYPVQSETHRHSPGAEIGVTSAAGAAPLVSEAGSMDTEPTMTWPARFVAVTLAEHVSSVDVVAGPDHRGEGDGGGFGARRRRSDQRQGTDQQKEAGHCEQHGNPFLVTRSNGLDRTGRRTASIVPRHLFPFVFNILHRAYIGIL